MPRAKAIGRNSSLADGAHRGRQHDSASGNARPGSLQRTGLAEPESMIFDELLKLANCQFHHGDHTGVFLCGGGNALTWAEHIQDLFV